MNANQVVRDLIDLLLIEHIELSLLLGPEQHVMQTSLKYVLDLGLVSRDDIDRAREFYIAKQSAYPELVHGALNLML
jgi:hypothetical protein